MAIRSIYIPDPSVTDGVIRIEGEEHRHLLVARAEAGEPVEIFDGAGGVWTAEVIASGRNETLARVIEARIAPPDPYELILGLALIRPAAFELALEKAVETGVTRIVPFTAARSNSPIPRRPDRWARIVVEAAKQSKRYRLPALDAPVGFDRVLSTGAASKIIFAERDGGPLKSALAGSPVLYLIGPEGGWTDAERTAAAASGFVPVHLGTGILKSETAAIAGAILIRYELENA